MNSELRWTSESTQEERAMVNARIIAEQDAELARRLGLRGAVPKEESNVNQPPPGPPPGPNTSPAERSAYATAAMDAYLAAHSGPFPVPGVIAAETGLAYSTVTRHLRARGLLSPPRSQRKAKALRRSPAGKRVREVLDSGEDLSVGEIASRAGVAEEEVGKALGRRVAPGNRAAPGWEESLAPISSLALLPSYRTAQDEYIYADESQHLWAVRLRPL